MNLTDQLQHAYDNPTPRTSRPLSNQQERRRRQLYMNAYQHIFTQEGIERYLPILTDPYPLDLTHPRPYPIANATPSTPEQIDLMAGILAQQPYQSNVERQALEGYYFEPFMHARGAVYSADGLKVLQIPQNLDPILAHPILDAILDNLADLYPSGRLTGTPPIPSDLPLEAIF